MDSTCFQCISIALGLPAFVFSIWKYFDQRQREIRVKRFEQYHKVFNLAAGRTEEGVKLTDVHQVMAIYQLREFSEFKHYSLPILDYWMEKSEGEPNSLFRLAVEKTRNSLAA